MIIAQVIGTVVASQKEPRLHAMKLLVLQPVDTAGVLLKAAPVVACDAVGAGLGDVVFSQVARLRGKPKRPRTSRSMRW